MHIQDHAMHAATLQQLWLYDSFDDCWFAEHCTIEALSYSAVHEASEGAHFLHLACQGGAARTPVLPVSYATLYKPGVGKLVQWKSHLQKTKNTSEPQKQFVVSI